jgi:hypothetical protein
MFILKNEIVRIVFQLNLDICKKCRVPINGFSFFFSWLHRKPPYSVLRQEVFHTLSENFLLIWIKARIF